MNLDSIKLALSKFNIQDTKTIKAIAYTVLSIILIVDILLFSSLIFKLNQVNTLDQKNEAALKFFKSLVSKKDNLSNARLIPEEKIENLLVKIQNIAKKYGIEAAFDVNLASNQKGIDKKFYSEIYFPMTATGNLKSMGIFLTTLRNLPDVILDIGNLNLTGSSGTIPKVQASITFIILTKQNDEDQ